MKTEFDLGLEAIRRRKLALDAALKKDRSNKWVLRLWSRFVKTRDLYRCLCCDSTDRIQAHHVIRKTLYPLSAFETGNGITLCLGCHRRIHAEFNRRPNLSLPLGAEQGDDQDEWAFLFGLLRDDAIERGLDEDEFYYFGDHMLEFSVRCQGYKEFRDLVINDEMSRIRFAHEIWRLMPELWYTSVLAEIVKSTF